MSRFIASAEIETLCSLTATGQYRRQRILNDYQGNVEYMAEDL